MDDQVDELERERMIRPGSFQWQEAEHRQRSTRKTAWLRQVDAQVTPAAEVIDAGQRCQIGKVVEQKWSVQSGPIQQQANANDNGQNDQVVAHGGLGL